MPEGDVFGIALEAGADGALTGRPAPDMPLTWRDGKPRAIAAHGLAERLRLAVGNSMDDVPMLDACPRGAARMLCVPRAAAGADPWAGAAEDTARLAQLACERGFWLHEATSGACEYEKLLAAAGGIAEK